MGKHPSTSRTRWLRLKRPMILCWRRHGKAGGCQIHGGVAQLGEHLPCKQGVKSSNLSVSTDRKQFNARSIMYLENFIHCIDEKDLIFKSRHPRNKPSVFLKNTSSLKQLIRFSKKMQRYASKRLSKKERRVDALALRAEERRDKLR